MKTTKPGRCAWPGRVGFAFAALLWSPLTSQGELYQLLNLGTLGGDYSEAVAINETDQVIGTARTANGQFHAFLWTADAGMRDLGTLGGESSRAVAINHPGQIVGTSLTPSGEDHAFIWDPRTGMRDLGTAGGTWSKPFALNNRGQVIGLSEDSTRHPEAFFWSQPTGMKKLHCLGGGTTRPMAINDAGEIVGMSYTSEGYPRAYRCTTNGKPHEIHAPGYRSHAWAVNEAGKVVGSYALYGGSRSFYWTPATGLHALEHLGCRSTFAKTICGQGQIAGSIEIRPGEWWACVWDPEGKVQLLPATDGIGDKAVAINDEGVVIGRTKHANGQHRAFVWTAEAGLKPLPLPDSDSNSTALDLNRKGTIVGYVESSTGRRACLWHNDSGGRTATQPVAKIR